MTGVYHELDLPPNLYEVALFAGVGGGVLGTKYHLDWRTVCYVEFESYPIQILKARIKDGWLDDAPIWTDIRSFTKRNNQCRRFIRELRKNRNRLVVTAGFPCQPFSNAGQRRGMDDPSNGWPHTIRLINEIRPRWVFLENVPGLLSSMDNGAENPVGYYGTILADLAQSGYDCRWDCLPASAIGGNHQRDRLWVVAHANG
jgi:DNA (cytosine-5)-methyltransferase 1